MEEKIIEWKKKYGKVYKAEGIIFRALTRAEYIKLITQQTLSPQEFDYELEVSKLCILDGATEEDLINRSGLSTILSEQILIKSGFTQVTVEEL